MHGNQSVLDSNVDVRFFTHKIFEMKKQKKKKLFETEIWWCYFPFTKWMPPSKDQYYNWLFFFFSFLFCFFVCFCFVLCFFFFSFPQPGCCCSLTNSCFDKYGTLCCFRLLSRINTTTSTLHTAHWGRGTTPQDWFISRSSLSRILHS